MKPIIGIIGYGNMGSAIAERLKAKYKIFVFDKDGDKIKNLSGIEASKDLKDLIKNADVVILAIKPQDFESLLIEIKDLIKDKLVISIAAGITTAYLEKRLGQIRIVRVMPNLPAKIGMGMSCLCKGKSAKEEDLNFAKNLFYNLGQTLFLNEDMMDFATAVSGSGPGFFYYLVKGKSLAQAKKVAKDFFVSLLELIVDEHGCSESEAKILAEATTKGSIAYLEATKLPAEELVKKVASKGGTTVAGLEVLQRGGSLREAVKAAIKRSKELSKKE